MATNNGNGKKEAPSKPVKADKAKLSTSTKDVLADPVPITLDIPTDIALAKLDTLIKNPPEVSRVIHITPELAERILTQRNLNNRPMKTGKIKDYARDLKEGRWGLTGDTLKFGKDGSLRDGQNRLAATIRAQIPLATHAVFGIDPDLFSRMDIGKNRTASDIFAIAGFHYANYAAAAVRWLLILTSDKPGDRSAHFTNDALLSAYRKEFDPVGVEESVKIAIEVKKATGAPVGSVAALHYLFKREDGDKADHFFRDWIAGTGKANSPVKVLQKKLTEMAVETNGRIHETVRNALITQAYIAYRDDKTMKPSDLHFDPKADTFPALAA